MAIESGILASYVAVGLVRTLASGTKDEPLRRSVAGRGAMLLADLSGFTPLTERYAQRGQDGVEELSALLNGFFAALVDATVDAGGEVVSFAGDSTIGVWTDEGTPLDALVRRAASAALDARARVSALLGPDGKPLVVRFGIGAGNLSIARFGQTGERSALAVYGPAADDMVEAQLRAAPGDIVIAPGGARAAGATLIGTPLEGGAVRLDEVDASQVTRSIAAEGRAGRSASTGTVTRARLTSEDTLRPFAPLVAVRHAEEGLLRLPAEIRRVSPVFVNVGGVPPGHPSFADRVDAALAVASRSLAQHDGSVHQLVVDEKGVVIVGMFGHPYQSQEQISARATLAAMAMARGFRELGLPASIGVGTGRAFCGPVGASRRREYATVGTVMNRTARIMQAAVGEVRVDAATAEAAADRVFFRAEPPLTLKGLAEPVATFTPQGAVVFARPAARLIGREEERRVLDTFVAEAAARRPGVLVLEGPAGIGKSLLASEVLQSCAARGVRSLTGYADMVRRDAPYRPWHAVVVEVFGGPAAAQDPVRVRARLARLSSLQEGFPEAVQLAPLLSAFGVGGLPDNEETARLSGAARARTTHALLCAALADHAQGTPTVLYFDDLHWADEASLALLVEVVARVRTIGILATTRPFPAGAADAYTRLLAVPGVTRLELSELGPAATRELAAYVVGAASLPEHIARWVHGRSGGNPFFARELAASLVQHDSLRIVDGQCTFAASAAELEDSPVPATVEGVVASRIERLGLPEQLALRAASVIGKEFTPEAVAAVLRDRISEESVLAHLGAARREGMIERLETGPRGRYQFAHDITLKVAYARIVGEDRRRMHGAAAIFCEESAPEARIANAAVLANHYARAGLPGREIEYLDLSAQSAARSGATAEAQRFLERALAIEPDVDAGTDDAARLRRVRRRRMLADAYYARGNREGARRFAVETTAQSGAPLVLSGPGMAMVLATQLCWHVAAGVLGPRIRATSEEARGLFEEASAGAQIITYASYLEGQKLIWLVSCVYSAARALRAGPSGVSARGLVTMAGALGTLHIEGLANFYYRLAYEAADRSEDTAARHFIHQIEALVANGNGEWRVAAEKADACIRFYRAMGDLHELGVSLTLRLGAGMVAGFVPESLELGHRIQATAEESGNILAEGWGLKAQAEALLHQGADARALAAIRAAVDRMERNHRTYGGVRNDAPTEAAVHAMEGLALWRLGERASARQQLEEGVSWLRRYPLESYPHLDGYWCSALAYTLVVEEGGDRSALAGLDVVLGMLSRFALIVRMARPRAALVRGIRASLGGRPARARKEWRRALTLATEMEMFLDIALAEHHLGVLDADATRLGRAHAGFVRCGADWWTQRAEDALARLGVGQAESA